MQNTVQKSYYSMRIGNIRAYTAWVQMKMDSYFLSVGKRARRMKELHKVAYLITALFMKINFGCTYFDHKYVFHHAMGWTDLDGMEEFGAWVLTLSSIFHALTMHAICKNELFSPFEDLARGSSKRIFSSKKFTFYRKVYNQFQTCIQRTWRREGRRQM